MIIAELDSKRIGAAVNALAADGRIKPVRIRLATGLVLPANSAWAATDWLKSQGYYGTDAESLPSYRVEDGDGR